MREPLHFNQNSPLHLPLPMMLAAPLFGIAALLVALFAAPSILGNRWDPLLVSAVHLFTLGFLGCTMLAAIMQVLPVLTGRPPLRNRSAILVIQCGFIGGLLLFAVGMAIGNDGMLRIATVSLGAGLAVFLSSLLPQFGLFSRIRGQVHRRPALGGIATALCGLVVTATLGLWLLSGWGFASIILPRHLTDVHASWAMLGWVAPLVFAVSLEVVPMFQFTRPLPRLVHAVPIVLPAALMLASLSITRTFGIGLLAAMLVAGSLAILERQWRRPHGVADGTFRLFRIAMLSLLASIIIFLLPEDLPASISTQRTAATLLFLAGFAGSCVIGMLLKIVPFLVRLHLQKILWELGLPARSLPGFTRMLPTHADRWLWLPHAAGLLLATAGILAAMTTLLQAGLCLLALSMTQASVVLWRLALQARRLQRELATQHVHGGLA